jgi:hypothetical protein
MRRDRILEARPELFLEVAQIGRDQFVLGGEAAVEARLGDAGSRDDLVDADRADAATVEQLARDLADAIDGALAARAPDRG